MRRHGPWAILQIDPTDDLTAIKRAYAKQLKVTHPEDDAAGFQALREAYVAAQNHAKWAEQHKQWEAERAARGEPPPQVSEEDDLAGEDDFGGAEDITAQIIQGMDLPPVSPGRARPATPEEKAANPEVEPAAPPEPPKPRVRVTAAAEMDLAEPPAELKEIHEAEQRHVALIQQLVDLVADDNATESQRCDALEAVLKSPAMDMVIVNERTEHFLGGLIANNPRRTDEMVDRVINFFGWDAARVGAWRPIAEAALRRREEVVELNYLRSPGTKGHGAYRALSQPLTTWRKFTHRLAIHRGSEVRTLLWNMQERLPGLMGELNAETVAWWEDHFSRPRIGPIALWGLFIGVVLGLGGLAALAVGNVGGASAFGNLAVIPGAVAAALIGKHYAIDHLRELVGKRFNWNHPAWVRYGWLPATLLPVAASAFIPASLIATLVTGALAALPLLWALVVADPDRSPDEDGGDWSSWGYMSLFTIPFYLTQWLWRPVMRYPWQVRTVFGFGFLGIFYAVVLQDMNEGSWGQMMAPVAAAAFAVSFGMGALIDGWRHDTDRKLRTIICGVAIGCGLIGFGLSLAGPAEIFGPASILFLLVPVLVQKAPAKDAGEGLRMFRDAITRYGWMLWFIYGGVLISLQSAASPMFRVAVPWILTGPLTVLILTLWREWAPRKPKPQRARWDR